MQTVPWLLFAYVGLSFYDAGQMWVLQLMHYPLYRDIGGAEFAAYVAANNRHAVLPAILPSLATLVLSIVLVFRRPPMLSVALVLAGVACNVAVLLSTLVWQGRLHGELARVGKSDVLIDRLVATNWVRTLSFTVQAALAMVMLAQLFVARHDQGELHG